jgi:hypothetical protein
VLTVPPADLEASIEDADAAEIAVDLGHCLVCGGRSPDSLCEACRARIRMHALRQRLSLGETKSDDAIDRQNSG